jgi:hypothetical protein
MIKIVFSSLVLFLPLSLQAQVYRCDSSQGPVFSQMPCAADAERLVSYDPVIEIESEQATKTIEKPPSAMENFVITLHQQQQRQMAELDDRITQLKSQIAGDGEHQPDENLQKALTTRLATLTAERESVSNQYVALINEAESRAFSADSVN